MGKRHIFLVVAASALVMAAGCGNNNEVVVPTNTAAPTVTTAPTNTAAPTATTAPTNTAAPTVTTAPTNTAAPTATTAPMNTPTPTPVIPEKTEIVSVEEIRDNVVAVTLNTMNMDIDVTSITITKNLVNWTALSKKTLTFDAKTGVISQNAEGYTVITYSIENTTKFSNLEEAIRIADNYVSWQMSHGGWDKGVSEQAASAWNGKEKRNKFSGWSGKNGEELGTIDNDATYTQMRHIAAVYREVPDEVYQDSVLRGLNFIFKLQYESGGFAQVYPRRGNYSDNVTFNDDAMINVLIMLNDMKNHAYPFDSDIIPDEYMPKIEAAIDKAVDYILKAQIVSNGKLTAWCAQHDPVTYEAVGARAYELPSISGKESVAIVKFLLTQEQTPEVENAINCAMEWFYEAEDKGVRYVANDPNGVYFVEDANSTLWYRFYDIETGEPFFCDRDGIKKFSIAEISEERRNGYSWSDTYPRKLLQFYEKYGLVFTEIQAKLNVD